MSIKMKKSELVEMVKEALIERIQELVEAPGVVDAEKEKKDSEKKDDKKSSGKEDKPKKDDPKPPKPATDDKSNAEEPVDLPVSDEPADKSLEKDVADDKAEDSEDVTGGKIADELTGKTIQSLTMEPDSKTLPGAQEIVLTFNEVQDPLKILITKTGNVKFYYKGLHNKLSEADEPGGKAPYKTSPEQMGGHSSVGGPTTQPGERRTKSTKHGNSFSMTNDEYLSWIKFPPHLTITNPSGKVIATMRSDQVAKAVQKARFMRGMSKNVKNDVDYFVADIVRTMKEVFSINEEEGKEFTSVEDLIRYLGQRGQKLLSRSKELAKDILANPKDYDLETEDLENIAKYGVLGFSDRFFVGKDKTSLSARRSSDRYSGEYWTFEQNNWWNSEEDPPPSEVEDL